MSGSMLVTRPDHEIVTKYCCVWSERLVKLAQQKGLHVYDLKGAKATRRNFESYVKKNQPSLIFLNGHGSAEVVTGYDNEPLADMASEPAVSIFYARSCDAAALLGPALVQKGARAFVGYVRKFVLYYDPEYTMRLEEDPMAGLFLDSSNLVVSTLLKGHAVAEAHRRSKEVMAKNLRKMISSAATPEERYAASAMWSNMTNQVALGDLDATI